MIPCPCGSGNAYSECCEPLITGQETAQTAETLMRARYTAFAKSKIDYIRETLLPDKQKDFNRKDAENWSNNAEWLALEIIETQAGGPADDAGTVEFVARYREKGERTQHHELAEFKKIDGKWYFADGHAPTLVQSVRQGPKIGRNDPCPCGSGKKFKKCCGG